MKKIIFILSFSLSAMAADVQHLTTINAEVAKAAFASYKDGHYRYIQNGQLIEAFEVDESSPSCILEAGKMNFDPEATYALTSSRSLDNDEGGEIELSFETQSANPDSYLDIYCFQNEAGANTETARSGLKSVFEIK